jgi:hypothetical protein
MLHPKRPGLFLQLVADRTLDCLGLGSDETLLRIRHSRCRQQRQTKHETHRGKQDPGHIAAFPSQNCSMTKTPDRAQHPRRLVGRLLERGNSQVAAIRNGFDVAWLPS